MCQREIPEVLREVDGSAWGRATSCEVRLGKSVGDVAVCKEKACSEFALGRHFVVGVSHELIFGKGASLAEGKRALGIEWEAGVNRLRGRNQILAVRQLCV